MAAALTHLESPPELEIGEGGFHLTSRGNAIIVVWRCPATARRLGMLVDAMSILERRVQKQIVLLNLIGEEAPLPGMPERALLQRQFASMRGRVVAMATVLEKNGVEGALSRALLRTLLTLSRQPFLFSVFSERPEAEAWLVQQCPAAPAIDILHEALERVNARALQSRGAPA